MKLGLDDGNARAGDPAARRAQEALRPGVRARHGGRDSRAAVEALARQGDLRARAAGVSRSREGFDRRVGRREEGYARRRRRIRTAARLQVEADRPDTGARTTRLQTRCSSSAGWGAGCDSRRARSYSFDHHLLKGRSREDKPETSFEVGEKGGPTARARGRPRAGSSTPPKPRSWSEIQRADGNLLDIRRDGH